MQNESIGKITKITGSKVTILVHHSETVSKVSVDNFVLNYISIGALLGTKLVDGRTLVLTVEEIYRRWMKIYIKTYKVWKLPKDILPILTLALHGKEAVVCKCSIIRR